MPHRHAARTRCRAAHPAHPRRPDGSARGAAPRGAVRRRRPAVTRTALLDRDCARLDRDALHTAAALLRDLAVKAEPAFDEFQRPIDSVQPPPRRLPARLAAAAVYAHAATQERTVSRWLRVLT